MSIGVDTTTARRVRRSPEETARELERALRTRGTRRWTGRLSILGGLALAGWGGHAYYERHEPAPLPRFITEKIARHDISEEVLSTGKVKPLKEVQVGAQVSGRVVSVSVDFNSPVKKGEQLAEIDPRVFGAQVSQTRAQIDAAKAQVDRAQASLAVSETLLARIERLQKDNLSTRAELDQAVGNRNVAKADVAAAQAQLATLVAQLASVRTTLQYTRILSPIDGIVITRSIDPGQTVAASFAAPVLFVIAPDLRQMQVLADIDEADVGKVKQGMTGDVVVDAFPGETFEGKVTQIRYSPNEVQGVVTYSAVIDVANPDMKLRPGMTATVTLETRRAHDVPALPNAALRFRPTQLDPSGGAAPATQVFGAELKAGEGRVYVPSADANEATEKVVDIGITDGRFTELRSGLAAGAAVVIDQRDAKRPDKFLGIF